MKGCQWWRKSGPLSHLCQTDRPSMGPPSPHSTNSKAGNWLFALYSYFLSFYEKLQDCLTCPTARPKMVPSGRASSTNINDSTHRLFPRLLIHRYQQSVELEKDIAKLPVVSLLTLDVGRHLVRAHFISRKNSMTMSSCWQNKTRIANKKCLGQFSYKRVFLFTLQAVSRFSAHR